MGVGGKAEDGKEGGRGLGVTGELTSEDVSVEDRTLVCRETSQTTKDRCAR